jgi:hypothetical protein
MDGGQLAYCHRLTLPVQGGTDGAGCGSGRPPALAPAYELGEPAAITPHDRAGAATQTVSTAGLFVLLPQKCGKAGWEIGAQRQVVGIVPGQVKCTVSQIDSHQVQTFCIRVKLGLLICLAIR